MEAENIRFFQETLLEWFKTNGRKFPWRKPGLSAFEIILTEVLLQRTKAETIKRFYPIFFSRFNNWLSLVNTPINELEDVLRPIGLYKQRAARINQLAQTVININEAFPTVQEELESIPMIGQYIANSIKLMLHEKPAPLLDVNMARLLERFFGERKLADIRYDPYLQDLAFNVVDHPYSKKINWAILDFAALICKARRPLCEICPLKEECNYFFREVINNSYNLE